MRAVSIAQTNLLPHSTTMRSKELNGREKQGFAEVDVYEAEVSTDVFFAGCFIIRISSRH